MTRISKGWAHRARRYSQPHFGLLHARGPALDDERRGREATAADAREGVELVPHEGDGRVPLALLRVGTDSREFVRVFHKAYFDEEPLDRFVRDVSEENADGNGHEPERE